MVYKEGKPLNQYYGILYDNNNQEIYEGTLIDQRPEKASNASIFYDNGNLKYFGDFMNFKYNGKGKIYYEKTNGKIYFDGMFNMDEFANGVLYDPFGIKIYEGEFMNNIPKEGNNLKIYEYDENLKYEGVILNGQYNGFGKLYQKGINSNYYEGNFLNGFYDGKGILYDFINDGYYYGHYDKKFEGEFKNGLFHGFGKGKLYKKNDFALFLFYEGYFIEGKFEGNGKIYYQSGNKFFEGIFKNNEINGKGIKYYINGQKKIEGIFKTLNSCKGKYYNPNGKEIYNGLILNEIPAKSNNIIIYDDHSHKIYEGETQYGAYNGKGIEYSNCIENLILYKGNFINNYYIEKNLESINIEAKDRIKVLLISNGQIPGKTCLIDRIVNDDFPKYTLTTMGVDIVNKKYEYNNNNYIIDFIDINGNSRVQTIISEYLKITNIVIYLIDLTQNKEINEGFIYTMKENLKDNSLFYVVGNKLDLTGENFEEKIKSSIELNKDYKINIKKYRNQTKYLILYILTKGLIISD